MDNFQTADARRQAEIVERSAAEIALRVEASRREPSTFAPSEQQRHWWLHPRDIAA